MKNRHPLEVLAGFKKMRAHKAKLMEQRKQELERDEEMPPHRAVVLPRWSTGLADSADPTPGRVSRASDLERSARSVRSVRISRNHSGDWERERSARSVRISRDDGNEDSGDDYDVENPPQAAPVADAEEVVVPKEGFNLTNIIITSVIIIVLAGACWWGICRNVPAVGDPDPQVANTTDRNGVGKDPDRQDPPDSDSSSYSGDDPDDVVRDPDGFVPLDICTATMPGTLEQNAVVTMIVTELKDAWDAAGIGAVEDDIFQSYAGMVGKIIGIKGAGKGTIQLEWANQLGSQWFPLCSLSKTTIPELSVPKKRLVRDNAYTPLRPTS